MRIYKYTKKAQAKKKVSSMKKRYGYKPTIFKEKNPQTNKVKYIVVKPRGLKWVS